VTTEQANAGAEQGGHEAVPLLRLTEVSVQFGGIRAVDSVSFDVQAGEVVAIVGRMAPGKLPCSTPSAGSSAGGEPGRSPSTARPSATGLITCLALVSPGPSSIRRCVTPSRSSRT